MSFDYLDIDSATGNVPARRVGDLVPYPDSPTAYPGQLGIDWTPAARELGMAVRKRESRAQKMLARLKCGPATTLEMMTLGGAGFSSRLRELRNAGNRITCEQHVHEGSEWAVYTLEVERTDYENETPFGQQLMDGVGDWEEEA